MDASAESAESAASTGTTLSSLSRVSGASGEFSASNHATGSATRREPALASASDSSKSGLVPGETRRKSLRM